MAKRHNPYEAAFEDYLRVERAPYVAVDERRRALARGGSLKSVDFIVSLGGEPAAAGSAEPSERWLVDVKGRRFPSGGQYWRNWATREDLRSLAEWSTRFGPRFESVLVFAYAILGDRSPVPASAVHYWREQPYGFVAVRASDYAARAHTISKRWNTVAVRADEFRRIARPLTGLWGEPHSSDAADRSVPPFAEI